MNRSYILLVCMYFPLMGGLKINLEQIHINERTESIYRRYYLVKRLSPSIKLLKNINIQQQVSLPAIREEKQCILPGVRSRTNL